MTFTVHQHNDRGGVHRYTSSDLNSVMEFDHVIYVDELGDVHEGTMNDVVFPPSLCDDELDTYGWTFFTYGYSGQHGYNGPIMHNSETIAGSLAADILAQPGYYVALVSTYTCEGWHEAIGEDIPDDCDGDHAEGWAVAYREKA